MEPDRFEIYNTYGNRVGYVDLSALTDLAQVYAVRGDHATEVGTVTGAGVVFRSAGVPFEIDRGQRVGYVSTFHINTGTPLKTPVAEVGHVIPETAQILKGGKAVRKDRVSVYEHGYEYVGAVEVGYALRRGRRWCTLKYMQEINAVGGAALLLGLV